MQDSVSVQVVRGSESWQFFAFIFAAAFALGITLLEEFKPLEVVALGKRDNIEWLVSDGRDGHAMLRARCEAWDSTD